MNGSSEAPETGPDARSPRKRRVMAVGAGGREARTGEDGEQPPRKRRVMAVGVFDLLHLGHVYYLTEAKKHGDELVVVVATDKSVTKRKHEPILPQDMRAALVAALKPVDVAVVGHPTDRYKTVEDLDPDVIALGWDDYHQADDLRQELRKRGLGHVEIVRMPKFDQEHDLAGTRRIVRRIMEIYRAAPMAPPAEPKRKETQEEAK